MPSWPFMDSTTNCLRLSLRTSMGLSRPKAIKRWLIMITRSRRWTNHGGWTKWLRTLSGASLMSFRSSVLTIRHVQAKPLVILDTKTLRWSTCGYRIFTGS
jgi:hypothetical protein